MTTEIGFALFAGTVLAGAAYFGVTELMPHLFGSLRGRWNLIGPLALAFTVVVFVAVVATVLTRFRRATRPDRTAAAQPSQPGRTNPDS
jgi:hypothetical protein